MKKRLVILLVMLAAITTTTFFAFKNADKVKGWFLAGSYPSAYDIGVEKSTDRNGNVAFLKSIKPVSSGKFGTIMQSFTPTDYLGKRVKLTGYIKAQDVKDWVGMWFRIDGETKKGYKTLGFDNMQDRPIKGTTDWQKYEIVLDVPEDSQSIAFGVLLSGTGTVWIDDLSFQIVPKDTPQTKLTNNNPQNINFEEPNN